MAKRRKHKDVEYYVGGGRDGEAPAQDFDEAATLAVVRSVSTGQPVIVDVVIFSRAGAKFYGGDEGVAQYKEDPEASVFERIVIQAQSQGRVP